MFQFFRINDPYRLIVVFILALVLRGVYYFFNFPMVAYEFKWLLIGERLGDGFSMYRDLFDYTAPLSAVVYWFLDVVFGRSIIAHEIFATLLLALNASLFNILLVRNRSYEENNYLPALFYLLIGTSIPDFTTLSPQLMSSFFILLALNNVFRRIDNQVEDGLFLNSGLYLGIASLFYFPSILFVLLLLVALLLFSTAIMRRILLYLYGFVIPFLLTYGYYYWLDSGNFFLEMIWAGISGPGISYVTTEGFFYTSIILSVWLLIGLYGAFFLSRQGNYEFRILQVMFLFLLTAIGTIFIDREISIHQLILAVPPLSYFLTYYALSIRKRIWKAIMPTFITLGLLITPFVLRINFLDIATVSVPDKPIAIQKNLMVCDGDLNYYVNNYFTSPFLDPYLSHKAQYRLKFYNSAEDVYASITSKYPEVIIDNTGFMDPYFEVFPLLRRQYRATSYGYIRRPISN